MYVILSVMFNAEKAVFTQVEAVAEHTLMPGFWQNVRFVKQIDTVIFLVSGKLSNDTFQRNTV